MATVTPPSDWQTGKTLSESLDHIFTSGIASDVTFIVGEDKTRISAHKLVLISRSPVFYAMLEGPMAEKGEIIIPDVSSETFTLFLRYLYSDKINLTASNVVPVFNAARKYCVDILVSLCEEFLATGLSVNSACLLLEHAHVFVMDSLTEECLRFIDENPCDVLRSVAFTDLCRSCVNSITGNDDLCVTERNVYEAIINWADAECCRQSIEVTATNAREVLGETLYNVRYLHVDEDFLFGAICSDMILKPEDVVEIVNHNRNQKALVSEKLNTNKRIGILHRFRRGYVSTVVPEGFKYHEEPLSFTSSAEVYLYGFGSFHTETEPSSVNLTVYEEDAVIVQTTKTVAPSQPDKPHMGDVVLENPVKIRARSLYTIVARSENKKSHFACSTTGSATHEHVSIQFFIFQILVCSYMDK